MDAVVAASSLVTRAARLEEVVEHHLIQRNGLVLSWVDAETMKPFPPGFFTPDMDRMRHPGAETDDFGAYIAYENTGMCTGAYLCAVVWKYRATQDPLALEHARRTFRAIAYLYDVSQQIEPGFFSKFHCGRLSREMSSDQCLYAMVGLDQFAAVATESEKKKIREIIGGIAGLWVRRQYRHPYRDRNFDWPWPLNRFPVFNWLAWKHTGDARFDKEFRDLTARPEVREVPPFGFAMPKSPEKFLWPASPECTSSGATSLVPLLEHDAPERELWLRHLRTAYEEGRIVIGEDLLARGHFYYDSATGKTTTVDQPYYAMGKPNPVWRNKGYVCDVKSGHAPAMFARAALEIDPYHPDLGAAALALRILEATDIPQMVWKIDYRNQLPPDQKWMTRAFCGDALVNWLWAYWMARARGQLE